AGRETRHPSQQNSSQVLAPIRSHSFAPFAASGGGWTWQLGLALLPDGDGASDGTGGGRCGGAIRPGAAARFVAGAVLRVAVTGYRAAVLNLQLCN
ncbi:unnamed protein product, partial [Urochloa humidicola]